MTITREEELRLLDADYYVKNGYPFEVWDKLRKEDPIHYVERGKDSYWAVTRHQDIISIESQAAIFENGPKLSFDDPSEGNVNMIINMDHEKHRAFRGLVSKHFMPKGISWARSYTSEIINEALDRAMAHNGEVIDLMASIAAPVPVSVIARYLGVPKHLWPKLVDWTDHIVGAGDPEYGKGGNIKEVALKAWQEMWKVYEGLFEERRTNPQDDLITNLLNAKINGEPIGEMELYSMLGILTTAGHETTKSAICGGIYTLITHPDQFEKVKKDPGLIPSMVDEILRWISPSVHFCRTPNRDVEVGGKKIRAGETMVMFYPSANRDEDVFKDPYKFDIERRSNRHMAFGTGPHICLGMHLAKLELVSVFEQLLPRLEHMETAGDIELVRTCVVGPIKRLPVRATILPRA